MIFKKLAEALQEIGYENFNQNENIEKQLYEAAKNKTRVVISGNEKRTEITSMILHVLKFHGIETDFVIGKNYDTAYLTKENDFIIIEANPNATFENLHANITLLSGISDSEIIENYKNYISKITSGGVLIYNEENTALTDLAENSENYFRKFPYKKPITETKNGTISVETELGSIPLQISDVSLIHHLEGAKFICQQLGILEEDFYEALMSF